MKARDQILYWAAACYHPLYEKYLLEEYEDEHGQHFDERHALDVVADMYSTDDSGVKSKGEHWSIDAIKEVIEPYELGEADTCWDAYVAINMWWHDLRCKYKKHYPSSWEDYLIEDAIAWAFYDEDSDDGKIWRYIYYAA